MKKDDLPKTISVFPLSNFIIFPKTTVPLNIFEPRYIDMVSECLANSEGFCIVLFKDEAFVIFRGSEEVQVFSLTRT